MAETHALLRHAVPDQLRGRRGHRPGAGVPVRDELVGVLEVRRRCVRRPARDRGAGRVLPRVDLPRAVDLRLEQALAPCAPGHNLARGAGHLAVRLLHPRRQLLDAASGGLQDHERRRAAHQRRVASVEQVRALRARAHAAGLGDDGLDGDVRHRLLALRARAQRRGLSPRRRALAHRAGAVLVPQPGARQPLRHHHHVPSADEDLGRRSTLEHAAARRLLAVPDRWLSRSSVPIRSSRSRSPGSARFLSTGSFNRQGRGPEPASAAGTEAVRQGQLPPARAGDLLEHARDGVPRDAGVPGGRARCLALPHAPA